MSTRSTQNKRTQAKLQGNSNGGMTRKSAGSAKPAREAASSVRVVPASSKAKRKQVEKGEDLSKLTKEEKKARKRELRAQEDRIYAVANILMKREEEYGRLRRIFWAVMAAGIGFTIAAWVLLMTMQEGASQTPEYILIGLAYVCIIGAFIFDFMKIRPIRNDARTRAEGMTAGKLDSILEQTAAEEEARRAARKKK